MTIFIIITHTFICLGLIALVLIQRGRGGGLIESFSGVESMFGTKTSVFLTKATTALSILFFVTCLSLAVIAARQSRSLMRDVKPAETNAAEEESSALVVPETETPQEN